MKYSICDKFPLILQVVSNTTPESGHGLMSSTHVKLQERPLLKVSVLVAIVNVLEKSRSHATHPPEVLIGSRERVL